MGRLTGRRIVVAGAGAVGAVLALRLRDDGAEVLLTDPAPLGANASGVAAGMLAPAFEAALDPVSAGHFELLRKARDLWPGLAERTGVWLGRAGALWVGGEASNAAVLDQLRGLGAAAEPVDAVAAGRLSQGLTAPGGAVFTSEDWTLDPAPMLAGLRRVFEEEGGEVRTAAAQTWTGTAVGLSDGQNRPADALVLASGLAAQGFERPPAELTVLRPIKGQLVGLAGEAPREGPVVRGDGVYVVPREAGPIVGATMEPGARDLTVDAAAVERLRAAAAGLYRALATAPASTSAISGASSQPLRRAPMASQTAGVRLSPTRGRPSGVAARIPAAPLAGAVASAR